MRSIPDQAIAPARLVYHALPVLLPLAGGLINRFARSTTAVEGNAGRKAWTPSH